MRPADITSRKETAVSFYLSDLQVQAESAKANRELHEQLDHHPYLIELWRRLEVTTADVVRQHEEIRRFQHQLAEEG
jgi:hypothetical protein